MRAPTLLGNEIFSRTALCSRHPLAMPKTAPTIELIKSFDWYDDTSYRESPQVSPRRIKVFHDPSYVDAAFDAEARQGATVDHQLKYGLGTSDNPIFPNVIHRAAVACGAAIKAARLLDQEGIVYSPLGGAHHAEPSRASGFGYFNDIVIGILKMLEGGLKPIAYIDLDAHHGNAVEAAFEYNPDVLTLSIHEENCWPHTGLYNAPHNGTFNLPVPQGFNDTEMAFLMQDVVLPCLARTNPQVIVIQGGADSLADDRMMRLGLSNRAYFEAIDNLRTMAPRLWVTGGGGYNPWAVVRCWAGIWCVLNRRDPADFSCSELQANLEAYIQQWPSASEPPPRWLDSLVDDPRPGPLRDSVRDSAHRAQCA